jgi:HlyD family secretion protein
LFVIAGGYFGYQNLTKDEGTVQYATATVEKGTLVVSVSGSGQVSVSDQEDIQPKVAGELVYLGVKNGQEVKKGALLAKIDTSDAQETIRDAELSLESAQLSLNQAQGSLAVDEKTLKKQALSYMSSALNNTKNIISSFQDIFFTDMSDYKTDFKYLINYYANVVKFFAKDDVNYSAIISSNFDIIKKENNANLSLFSHLSQDSSLKEIEDALNQITETTKTTGDSVHSAYQLLNRYEAILNDDNLVSNVDVRDVAADGDTVEAYVTLIDSNNTNLLSTQKSIESFNDAFSIQSLQLTVKQKENALQDAKDKLNDYYVYAPFDGVVVETGVKKGDSVSTGTVIATIITQQKKAEISLNEVDAATVKVGQKTTVTFDAIEDLTITGEVAEIDALGTVSQGVVTYDAEIVFDAQNEKIKSGMSVSVEIITDVKQDVLLVSNSAIKSKSGIQYVEIMGADNVVHSQEIETGISNDTYTEITGGLVEGDKVVTQTVSTGNSLKTNSSSNTRMMGGNSSNMEMIRMVR